MSDDDTASRVTGVACILQQRTYKPGDLPPSGYLAWHEWAEVQHKAGLRAKPCGWCGLWRFPQEMSGEMIQWRGFTSRGGAVDKTAQVCAKCAATVHASDCAMHDAPAYPAGACDCGVLGEQR